MSTELLAGRFEASETGLALEEDLSFEEWADIGKQLKRCESGVNWWIGDWLNYGERKYGEMYSQAMDELGLEYGSLRVIKYVASTFELLRRRNNVPWSHHREVASVRGLSAAQRQAWLDRAEAEGLSKSRLRTLLRAEVLKMALLEDTSYVRPNALRAEADENIHRLDLRPSERWEMAQALRPYEERAARERQREGGKAAGNGRKRKVGSGNLPEAKRQQGESSSRLAGLVGCSRRTLEKLGEPKIKAIVTKTASDADLLERAIRSNATHGLQLSPEDKRGMAVRIYDGTLPKDRTEKKTELARILSVSEKTISRWLENIDKRTKEERRKRIFGMWLSCWTQEEIAAEEGIPRQSITDEIASFAENGQLSESGKSLVSKSTDHEYRDFAPPIYNVWTFARKSNEVSHFGNTEAAIVDNPHYRPKGWTLCPVA